jgi:hypothetical protein
LAKKDDPDDKRQGDGGAFRQSRQQQMSLTSESPSTSNRIALQRQEALWTMLGDCEWSRDYFVGLELVVSPPGFQQSDKIPLHISNLSYEQFIQS